MEGPSGLKRPLSSPLKNREKKPVITSPILKELSNKTPPDRPFRVSIEGNIGAGKSTLIKYFQNINNNIETYGEPLEWWRNCNGHNLLDLMYTDINEWLKVFQSYVQLTRLKIQTMKPKNPQTKVQIFERSVQNNRYCFVETAYKNGYLTGPDYAVLDSWYQWIRENVNIDLDLFVYLKSTPEVVFERMKSRGRPEETGVSLDYLKQLHQSHENWLMTPDGTFDGIPVLVLDADQALDQIHEQCKQNESKILGYGKKGLKWDVSARRKVGKTLTFD